MKLIVRVIKSLNSECFNQEGKDFGTRMYIKMIMIVSRKAKYSKIKLNGQEIEQANTFVYFELELSLR